MFCCNWTNPSMVETKWNCNTWESWMEAHNNFVATGLFSRMVETKWKRNTTRTPQSIFYSYAVSHHEQITMDLWTWTQGRFRTWCVTEPKWFANAVPHHQITNSGTIETNMVVASGKLQPWRRCSAGRVQNMRGYRAPKWNPTPSLETHNKNRNQIPIANTHCNNTFPGNNMVCFAPRREYKQQIPQVRWKKSCQKPRSNIQSTFRRYSRQRETTKARHGSQPIIHTTQQTPKVGTKQQPPRGGKM